MSRFYTHHPLGDGRTLALMTWGFQLGRLSHVGQLWRPRRVWHFDHSKPTIDDRSHQWIIALGPITTIFTWRLK